MVKPCRCWKCGTYLADERDGELHVCYKGLSITVGPGAPVAINCRKCRMPNKFNAGPKQKT